MRWSSSRVMESPMMRLKTWERTVWLSAWVRRMFIVNSTYPHTAPRLLCPPCMAFSVLVA